MCTEGMECTSCGFSLPSLEQHPLNQHHPQSTHTHLSHHTRVYENIPIECLTLFPPINYHSLTPALPPLQSTRYNIQFYSTSSQVALLFFLTVVKMTRHMKLNKIIASPVVCVQQSQDSESHISSTSLLQYVFLFIRYIQVKGICLL